MKTRLQTLFTPLLHSAVMAFMVLVISSTSYAQTTNIIRNGTFASGNLANWSTYVADFAGVGATFAVTNGEAAITGITNAGAEVWHVQFIQVLTSGQRDSLTAGKFYKISFDARSSSAGRQLRMFFGENGGDFRPTKVYDITLSTDKKNYSTTFVLTEKFPVMKIGFEMGLSNASVFLDNITLEETSAAAGLKLPVSFDDATIDYKLVDFGGNASEIVTDPSNNSNKAVKTIKTNAAELWSGTTVGQPEGFASAIPFKAGSTKMSARVWSPHANIPVRLKVENASDPTISVETETTVTESGKWVDVVFDFSKQVTGTAALNFDYTYNKASIFFNFGKTGAEAGERTYYWDDLSFGDKPGVATSLNDFGTETPDGFILEQNYPNPFNPSTIIQFSVPVRSQVEIDIFNVMGQKVMTAVNTAFNAGTHNITIDASALSSGTYIYRLKTEGVTLTQRMTLIK